MKILNLYAGIGGNRKLWGDEHEITAVEINPNIAKVYHEFFPKDNVVIADAHEYLLEHYGEFDFIWSSPPCPSHSKLRRSHPEKIYPDMRLYAEIIFLKSYFKGKWVVENVEPYYEPLIKPFKSGRHCFWSNFIISNKKIEFIKDVSRAERTYLMKWLGIELKENIYVGKNHDHRQILRNCVHPKLGLHVLNMAFKEKQITL